MKKPIIIIIASVIMLCSLSFCAKKPDTVYIKMDTTLGTMYFALYGDKTPKTVENFLHYIETDFYQGTIFHRVINGFMVQGGGFLPGFTQKEPTREAVENEADSGLQNDYGTIAMARTSDPHSATSQFFINVSDNEFLNHSGQTPQGWGYCAFGKLVAGEKTLEAIRTTPVELDPRADQRQAAKPSTPIVIEDVSVVDASDKGLQEAMSSTGRKEEASDMSKEANAGNELEQAKALIKQQGYDPSKGKTTDSGLWYLHVNEGSGKSPDPSDSVTVHYEGWLVNGTKFDSSRDRGQVISFPLKNVIPGWTEGLGLMSPGGKSYFIIPYELAYGAQGRPPVIPPKAMLVFEVELFSIQ